MTGLLIVKENDAKNENNAAFYSKRGDKLSGIYLIQ